jgi:predicted MFS family arabinose efflux permease
MARPRSAAGATAWMCFAHILSMTGFSAYPTLLPVLQREWSLSNSQAGFIGGALFAGYMVCVPVLTMLTDRVDARRVYAAASVLSVLGALGFATFADGTATAATFQILTGAGVAGTYMPGLRVLTDTVGATHSRAISFYTASFGFGVALSIFSAGELASLFGWRTALYVAAIGPAVAAMMVLLGTRRVRHAHVEHAPLVAGIGRAWSNRRTRPYILGYAAHSWELFGSRSWLVAFLSFAQGASAWTFSPVAIAAFGNMLMPFSSVFGNEIAMRTRRGTFIRAAMGVSGVASCVLGFLAGAPWPLLCALVLLHMLLLNSDSGSLTSGVVAAAAPELRGTTLAIHSTFGFGAGFVAPLVFGAALDLAGAGTLAWGIAFVTIGIGGIVAALVLKMRD